MEEAGLDALSGEEKVERTDFFGGGHGYTRDEDEDGFPDVLGRAIARR